MRDWNVVLSVHEGGYTRARQLRQRYGPVSRTAYYNVLVMKVDDIRRLLEDLRARVAEDPRSWPPVARITPAVRCFDFQAHDDFEARAREAVLAWVPELGHKAFHVRLHRCGLRDELPCPEEERFLDHALLEALERAGMAGRISASSTLTRSWRWRPSATGPGCRPGLARTWDATRSCGRTEPRRD